MVESQVSVEQSERAEVRENKLNELSGTEWIKFTKSWFVHRPEPRGDQKIRHPASFPESLVREFIQFFTKKGQLVVGPFLGAGAPWGSHGNLDLMVLGYFRLLPFKSI